MVEIPAPWPAGCRPSPQLCSRPYVPRPPIVDVRTDAMNCASASRKATCCRVPASRAPINRPPSRCRSRPLAAFEGRDERRRSILDRGTDGQTVAAGGRRRPPSHGFPPPTPSGRGLFPELPRSSPGIRRRSSERWPGRPSGGCRPTRYGVHGLLLNGRLVRWSAPTPTALFHGGFSWLERRRPGARVLAFGRPELGPAGVRRGRRTEQHVRHTRVGPWTIVLAIDHTKPVPAGRPGRSQADGSDERLAVSPRDIEFPRPQSAAGAREDRDQKP